MQGRTSPEILTFAKFGRFEKPFTKFKIYKTGTADERAAARAGAGWKNFFEGLPKKPICGGFAGVLRGICGGFAGVLRVFCKLTGKNGRSMIKMATGSERKERFADAFYSSREWRRCRAGYARKQIYCERCMKKGIVTPGEHVHHKIRLTRENLRNPDVALNWDNLELLCEPCHKEEHSRRRWRADECGHIELPPL